MTTMIDPIHYQKRPVLHTLSNSPFGLKVHCFLTHKCVPFENIYLTAENMEEQLPVGRQVPVLTINGVSKGDSTPIGLWLDEVYPDRPMLLPADEGLRDTLLGIDQWVTGQLISLRFRASRYQDSGEPEASVKRGLILGELIHHTAPGGLDKAKRENWALIYQKVPFITRMMERIDLDEPIAKARDRIAREFIAHLEGGPFFAGQLQPHLPDLAAFPALVAQFYAGFPNSEYFLDYPELKAWAKRMETHLQGGMSIVPPRMIKRQLPD